MRVFTYLAKSRCGARVSVDEIDWFMSLSKVSGGCCCGFSRQLLQIDALTGALRKIELATSTKDCVVRYLSVSQSSGFKRPQKPVGEAYADFHVFTGSGKTVFIQD